ncbi:MAG: TonB-dependent receptor, partial [Pseudomonadales bacterium]|nr:TonB-dependent receptor [Pseudomonadales bacterium]
APDNQWSLNATWSPSRNWNLGAVLRGVDRLNPAFDVLVPGYTELDARLSWHPSAAFEVSIAGRNLLHDSHQEYTSELLDVPLMSVQRSIFGQLSLRF